MKLPSLKRIKFDKIILLFLTFFAVSIFVSTLIDIRAQNKLANTPVDVLKNWQIHVDDSITYQPGDTLTISSTFVKLVDVTGSSQRYIQCLKPGTKDWDGLVLANSISASTPKTANGHTQFQIGVPIALVGLPNTCRVFVNVTYNVNKYHPAFQEHTYSNSFTVNPRTGIVNDAGQTLIYTNTGPYDSTGGVSNTFPMNPAPIVIYQNSDQMGVQENAGANDNDRNLLTPILNLVKRLTPF